MSESDKVIGTIDREGCRGCADEHKPLNECCVPYVDLASSCVVCEAYDPADHETEVET